MRGQGRSLPGGEDEDAGENEGASEEKFGGEGLAGSQKARRRVTTMLPLSGSVVRGNRGHERVAVEMRCRDDVFRAKSSEPQVLMEGGFHPAVRAIPNLADGFGFGTGAFFYFRRGGESFMSRLGLPGSLGG